MASSGIKACGPSQSRAQHRLGDKLRTGLFALSFTWGCSPEVQVGTWTWACANPNSSDATLDGGIGEAAGATNDAASAPVLIPWSSGFEDGFCGYEAVNGFCYGFGGGAYDIVQSPVHSGRFAAAFSVDTSQPRGSQARCVREGSLPHEAYYGAWYFIPSLQSNTGNWNLFHFQGGAGPGPLLHGLWDVSLVNDANGNLSLTMLDFLASVDIGPNAAPPVPIGAWFHLQFFLRRAADSSGEVTVYQDGVIAYHLVNVVTDDSSFQQWYVGNLVNGNSLTSAKYTIDVDDVEIGEMP
jgi:hypothetical protein